jgi:pimeloyl-ACP methyl ester carboxylesterase
MNAADLLPKWSTLSLDEIETQLAAGADADAVGQFFGAEAAGELRDAAAAATARDLHRPAGAVVLLPGIMGSLLSSIRGVTTLLWINPALFLNGQLNYLELDSDGVNDRSPQIECTPTGIEKLFYLRISLALRRQAELYEFPYDWRRPIEENAGVLARCLERWADGDAGKRFTLVGHSMGGLVARAYLAGFGRQAEARIERVITLGTPYFGAADGVKTLLLGNSLMGLAEALNGANAPRSLLLNMPSVYELLPAPPELFPQGRDYPVNWDLYDATDWPADDIRPDYLCRGCEFHRSLARGDPQVETIQIAGCHVDTPVAVRRVPDQDAWQIEIIRRDRGPESGDGTVPLWSAVHPGFTTYFIQQRHRNLPADGDVIAAVLELIHGGQPDLPVELPPAKGGFLGLGVRGVGEPALDAAGLRRRLQTGAASAEDWGMLYFAV